MEITNSSLDQLDEDDGLDDGVAGGLDDEVLVVGLVEDAEGVAQVVLDLALGGDPDLVLSSLLLLPVDFLLVGVHFLY